MTSLTRTTSSIDRRALLTGLAAAALFPAALIPAALIPAPARAMTQAQAQALVTEATNAVQAAIASGRSEAQMIRDFEGVFTRFGDVPVIARSVLGPAARSASNSDLAAFTEAFRGYMSRKYGRQFRRFMGATVRVTGARQVQQFWEVTSTVNLRGEAPFEVRWHVSDRSGRPLFFNLIIEGVNVLAAERQEIGTMLERRRGNIAQLTEDLRRAG